MPALVRDSWKAEQLIRIALGVSEARINEHRHLRVLRHAMDELQRLLPIPLDLGELLVRTTGHGIGQTILALFVVTEEVFIQLPVICRALD